MCDADHDYCRFSLFYLSTTVIGISFCKYLCSNKTNMSNFHPLTVVAENLNDLI